MRNRRYPEKISEISKILFFQYFFLLLYILVLFEVL